MPTMFVFKEDSEHPQGPSVTDAGRVLRTRNRNPVQPISLESAELMEVETMVGVRGFEPPTPASRKVLAKTGSLLINMLHAPAPRSNAKNSPLEAHFDICSHVLVTGDNDAC
jgi:hypothetical protein